MVTDFRNKCCRHRRDFRCHTGKQNLSSMQCNLLNVSTDQVNKKSTSFVWFLIFFCAELRSVLKTRMSASRAAIWKITHAQLRYITSLNLDEKNTEYGRGFLLSTSSMIFLVFSSTPPSSSRSWPLDFSLSRIWKRPHTNKNKLLLGPRKLTLIPKHNSTRSIAASHANLKNIWQVKRF